MGRFYRHWYTLYKYICSLRIVNPLHLAYNTVFIHYNDLDLSVSWVCGTQCREYECTSLDTKTSMNAWIIGISCSLFLCRILKAHRHGKESGCTAVPGWRSVLDWTAQHRALADKDRQRWTPCLRWLAWELSLSDRNRHFLWCPKHRSSLTWWAMRPCESASADQTHLAVLCRWMVLKTAFQVNLGRSGCATQGDKVSEPRIVPVGIVAIFYLRDSVLRK